MLTTALTAAPHYLALADPGASDVMDLCPDGSALPQSLCEQHRLCLQPLKEAGPSCSKRKRSLLSGLHLLGHALAGDTPPPPPPQPVHQSLVVVGFNLSMVLKLRARPGT